MLGLQEEVATCITAAAVLTVMLAGLLSAVTKTGRSLWLWLLPVFLCAGFLRASTERAVCQRELSLELDGNMLELTGIVGDRKLREDGSAVLVLQKCELCETSRTHSENPGRMNLRKLQVYLEDSGEEIHIGSRLRVCGSISGYEPARNPGEFDFRMYYRGQKLTYRMFAERYEVDEELTDKVSDLLVLKEKLMELRTRMAALFNQIADPGTAGIYQAVLLGDTAMMDEDIHDLYQRNGIAHLLAVSGLHLSLVSMAVYGGMRRLGAGFGKAGLAGCGVLFAYAVLTGAAPSVLRAFIMTLCGFLAAYLGRTYDLMSAWSLTIVLLLWDSPYLILQAGVQLSFGAVAGIGWLAPALAEKGAEKKAEKNTGKHPEKRAAVLQTLVVSVSMQFVTLPMILYHFFQYPVYGMVLNFLVVPWMGIVIASGAAAIAFGTVNVQAGRFALGSGDLILQWYELCCRMAEQIPGNLWMPGRPDTWKIGVYYGILMSIVWSREKQRQKSGRHQILLLVVCVCLMLPAPARGLTVTFLDVGQGDGIWLETGETTILVDGGSTDQKKLGENRLTPFLKSQGISVIDYAIVSHGDQDHISGLKYLLSEEQDIRIRNLILPACGRFDEIYEALVQQVQARGGQVLWMQQGQSLESGQLRMTCLYPGKDSTGEDRNEHSLVLRVDYQNFHMLLTGDMTTEGEADVIHIFPETYLREIQVLKVAHHGSEYSTSSAWMDALSPRWSVISYGAENRYGHPSERVVRELKLRGSKVYETASCGAVTLHTDGDKILWKTYLDGNE